MNMPVVAAETNNRIKNPSASFGHDAGMDTMKNSKTVLIVDDSSVERTNLKDILKSLSLKVIEAEDGGAAIEVANSQHVDIIFLDIMMPGVDGFATCRTLHGSDKTSDIPVVMLSSKANRADKVWAEQMGATDYITKPYTAEQIIEKVKNLT